MATTLFSRKIPLQVSLATAFSGVVILTSLFLGIALYTAMSDSVRSAMRERLHNALGVAVVGFDVASHELIQKPGDAALPAYAALTSHLRQVRDRMSGVRFVYTFRTLPDGKLAFVLDAEEDTKLKSQIGQVMREQDITPLMRAAFNPGNDKVLVETVLTSDIYGVWLSGYVPLKSTDGRVVGVLGMDISAADVLARERSFLLRLATLCAIIAIVILPIGFIVSRWVSRPLALLAEEMGRVREFHLAGDAKIDSRIREVAQIAEAVGSMKSGLRSFRKYVPADLVRQLIRLGNDAHLGGESREITVFFSDIEGFTSISERTTPDVVVKHLAEYFAEMNQTLQGERGTIDKYIGDAVMAFWGAPEPVDQSALRACRAALACQEKIAALSRRWQAAGVDFHFATRIGLCHGEAIVGNIGSEDRLNYTTIGDVVNTASRLEAACGFYGVRILIADSVRLAAGEAIVTRAVDLVAVKGKHIPAQVHELVGLAGQVAPDVLGRVARHNAAFALFVSGHFSAAATAFSALADAMPDDRAIAKLLARCEELAATPGASPARMMRAK